MRILAVTTFLPYPQNHGDALRVLMMLQVLSRMGRLTALSVKRRDTVPADIEGFRSALPYAETKVFDLSSISESSSPRNRAMRLFKGIAESTPPLFFSPYSDSLDAFLRDVGPDYDLVVLIGEASGVYAKHFKKPYLIWDKANVFTSFSLNSFVNLRAPRQRIKFLFNAGLSYLWEKRVLRVANAVWVTAPEEAVRLQRILGRTADAVVRSAIRIPSSNPRCFDPKSRKVIWMSTFAYPPNWDGLVRLLEEAGDTMQQHNLRLCVVGAGASPEQIAVLNGFDMVEYCGFVENLDTVFDQAVAGIVPVWAGAGVKLKTITMMSRGLPVVSTPPGMEGIPPSAALRVSSSSIELVEALADSTEKELWSSSDRAFDIIKESFSEGAFRRSVSLSLEQVKKKLGRL